MGDRLAAPFFVSFCRAQIANPYSYGVPHTATVAWGIWVTCRSYIEAAPASVAKTVVGTERKLTDRSRKSGYHVYAARYRRVSR
jgi:hypothetical protein